MPRPPRSTLFAASGRRARGRSPRRPIGLAALLGVTLAGGALTGTGCAGWPVRGAAGGRDTVAIGVALNPERPGMEAIHQGVDLAIATLNADTATAARGIVFVARRTPRGMTSAVHAAQHLRDDPRVAGVVGDAESGRTLDALPVYEDDEGGGARAVVAVSPTATSVTLAGRSPWLFRLSPTDETASRAVAGFAADSLAVRRAAVVYRNDSYGRDWATAFARDLGRRGGEVVARDPYLPGVTDWTAYATYLAGLRPELVLFPGNAEDAAAFLRALRAAGSPAPLIGGDAMAPLADSGATFVGTRFAVTFEAGRADGAVGRDFVQRFRSRYREAPAVRAALGYEGAMLIGRAALAVGRDAPRRRAEVRDWIAGLGRTSPAFPGVAGPIAFDARHDVVGRGVVVATIGGGAVLETLAASAGAPDDSLASAATRPATPRARPAGRAAKSARRPAAPAPEFGS